MRQGRIAVLTEIRTPIASDADIVTARSQGRLLCEEMGFSASERTLVATAISEVARNIVRFARRGEIVVCPIIQNGTRGVKIVARDEGPGIPDIDLAMKDGYSTAQGLGLGLPGARRLMDEFEIISEVGKGTTITMKKMVP